ncbi:MAG: 4-alpha-glucanotransferase, partial [Pirellulaceae bacterium]
ASNGNGLAESLEASEVLRGCLQWLGGSEAQVVLVNLEDLWLETQPQNTPGTVTQRVNWRRKARLSLAELGTSEAVRALLAVLRDARTGAPAVEQAHRAP